MPETSPQPDTYDKKPLPTAVLGAIALFLVALAGFALAYTYFENRTQEAAAAAAAAAAANRPDPFDNISLQAQSAYVLDLTTGKVLYQKDAEAQRPLASLTKVAMALSVAEVLSPDALITIPYDTGYAGTPPTRLTQGQRLTVRNVMNFTLIASSNEGAQILADAADEGLRAKYPEAPVGSAALWRMNDLAKSLGLSSTRFLNVNGLDESTTQAGAYGSAADMAKLFGYAATSAPQIFAATAEEAIRVKDEDGVAATAHNTDEALGDIPGLIMGKTGYTDLAGGNLVTVFDVGLAHPVVAVVLGSTYDGRFSDMKTLVAKTRAAITQ